MRLVTYAVLDGGRQRVGMWEGNTITALSLADRDPETCSMRDVIDAAHDPAHPQEPQRLKDQYDVADVRLLAPLPNSPGNVICLGRNYAEHAQESARAKGQEVTRPTFFTKALTSIIGPYDDIPFDPALSGELDWEVELAVVIGRTARRVSHDEAIDYVFGYAVLNDISARDLQFGYGGQYFYGKSLDGSCPLGPCIVTADEVPNPQNLNLRLRVDGVIKQEDSTANMTFDVAECIAVLSRGMTLLPGQIIATGTPAGVGFARTPPEFLRPGNTVEAEIDGIGTLRNVVVSV